MERYHDILSDMGRQLSEMEQFWNSPQAPENAIEVRALMHEKQELLSEIMENGTPEECRKALEHYPHLASLLNEGIRQITLCAVPEPAFGSFANDYSNDP